MMVICEDDVFDSMVVCVVLWCVLYVEFDVLLYVFMDEIGL